MFNYANNGITVSSILDQRREMKDGVYPVKIRVTFKRERKYYSTGKNLSAEEWDKLAETKSKKQISIRTDVQYSFDKVKNAVILLEREDKFSFTALSSYLGKSSLETLNALFQIKIDTLLENNQINTHQYYAYTLKSVEEFAGKQISLSVITPEWMQKYGLDRGIKGSDARHISTPQFYRELHAQNQELKEEIAYKEEQIDEVNHSIRDLYERKDEAREKFLNMDMHVKQKEKDIPKIEAHIEKLRQEYEPLKTQEELNTIHRYFPLMKERLRIAEFCERIGLAFESIKALLHGKTLTSTAIKLFSPEHNRYFEAKDVRFKVEKEAENPNKLKLSINGENILDWFKKKFEEVKLAVDNRFQPKYDIERGQSRGVKM